MPDRPRLSDSLPADGLTGAVAKLRPLVEADAAWMTAAGEDSDIVRWNGVSSPYSLVAAQQLVALRQRGWDDDTRATFAVCTRDGNAGGYLSVRFGWPRGIAEVGYWLLPTHRHRGLATDAVRVVRDWCFDGLGIARLQAGIQPGNDASMAVVDRLGFTREGLLRSWDMLNGVIHDEWMYSLLPTDART